MRKWGCMFATRRNDRRIKCKDCTSHCEFAPACEANSTRQGLLCLTPATVRLETNKGILTFSPIYASPVHCPLNIYATPVWIQSENKDQFRGIRHPGSKRCGIINGRTALNVKERYINVSNQDTNRFPSRLSHQRICDELGVKSHACLSPLRDKYSKCSISHWHVPVTPISTIPPL